MSKISKEAQYLYNSFKGRFSSPTEAADLLKQAKDQLYFGGKPIRFMDQADSILGGSGVERIASSNGRAVAYYVNMGDTYDTTLVYQKAPTARFFVGSWGDWLEAQERRGNRFDGASSGGGFLG